MKKLICAVCLFLGATTSFHVFCAPPDTTPLLQQNLKAAQDEIKLLRTEIEVIQAYQDRFLTTVYWTLGTTAAVAVLLVGFGWFANFRIYDRDKVSLKHELHVSLNEETQKLQNIVEIHVANSKKSITEQIEKATEASVLPLRRLIRENAQDFDRKIASAERELLLLEHEKWSNKGVHVNALRNAVKILEVSKRTMASGHFVPDALELIQRDLKNCIGIGNKLLRPDAHMIAKLNQLLNDIGTEHIIITSAIKDVLSTIQSQA